MQESLKFELMNTMLEERQAVQRMTEQVNLLTEQNLMLRNCLSPEVLQQVDAQLHAQTHSFEPAGAQGGLIGQSAFDSAGALQRQVPLQLPTSSAAQTCPTSQPQQVHQPLQPLQSLQNMQSMQQTAQSPQPSQMSQMGAPQQGGPSAAQQQNMPPQQIDQ